MMRVVLAIAFAAWIAVWFWAFSFAFSASYFWYHLPSRLTFFLLALASAAAPPLSGFWVIKRFAAHRFSAFKGCVTHLLVTAIPVLLFWGVGSASVLIANRFGRLAFEADEAMGIGLQFLMCVAVFLAGNVLLWIALPIVSAFQKRARDPQDPASMPSGI
jgi:hypothetical protein